MKDEHDLRIEMREDFLFYFFKKFSLSECKSFRSKRLLGKEVSGQMTFLGESGNP